MSATRYDPAAARAKSRALYAEPPSPNPPPAPVEFHITSQDGNPVSQARETVVRLGKSVFFLIKPDVLPDDRRLGQLVRGAVAEPAPAVDSERAAPQTLSASALVLA
ncbi:hypothetical protein [Kitasatospora viridis]|uniref:Uncharacterized protein n=1 Tax=Kitasatospora viridis TaxID=281105 RepID=A0A561SFR6_9ACTN|nr:hypothetical protein [Kitasatospora viridis]TWF73721.1 hypothetical protein FHX73_15348 [Kitasatospora viridis]